MQQVSTGRGEGWFEQKCAEKLCNCIMIVKINLRNHHMFQVNQAKKTTCSESAAFANFRSLLTIAACL